MVSVGAAVCATKNTYITQCDCNIHGSENGVQPLHIIQRNELLHFFRTEAPGMQLTDSGLYLRPHLCRKGYSF